MAISDIQFKAGVFGAAGLLVLSITVVRFCGNVSLPAKPELQTSPAPIQVGESNAAPAVYQDYLAKDAANAAVRVPTVEEMQRKLLYRSDESRQVLEVGQAAITTAGLRLSAKQQGATIVLEIENTTKSDLAYHVVTEPTPKVAGCARAPALEHDAIVVAKGEREIRVECEWHQNMAIAVTLVETVEVNPLSAWYLNRIPPGLLGLDPRITRGHRIPKTGERCISQSSQAVRYGLENGEIRWRDLVDFYARHRCQTYPFPASYRALTSDGQRRIPAT